jgi:hypothetical protein
MFKQTGMSAIGAVGLFTLAQPILHHTGWKKAGKEVLLLVGGACITLTPIILWYVSMEHGELRPYAFILKPRCRREGVDVKSSGRNRAAGRTKPEKGPLAAWSWKLLPATSATVGRP